MTACTVAQKDITREKDYTKYLRTMPKDSIFAFVNQEITFWEQKMKKTGARSHIFLTRIAQQLERKFRQGGKIEDLESAKKLLEEANADAAGKESSVLQLLAMNCITRHDFQNAQKYIETAYSLYPKSEVTRLIKVDVLLELGKVQQAKSLLKTIAGKNNFNVLVRKAKILDHEGKLDEAIALFETALRIVQKEKNKDFEIWTLSNLGDFYGHAGKIEKAYQCYLQTLELDPKNDYALKGIAWIAYAHDKKTAVAKRILQFIQTRNASPDYLLRLAEIAEFENKEKEKIGYLSQFKEQVEKPIYGAMYHAYLHDIYTTTWLRTEKALAIAESEIRNRPCPQSYDLLAWTYYHQKEYKKALEIAEAFVTNKTFEPQIALHLGFIYLKNNQKTRAHKFFQEAQDASFELGPVTLKSIENNL
jgi:tetratricopeptide (TPR) repeat protein